MGRMTDSELVLASRRGETAAFGALIERYQGVVCAVTYSRTGDRSLSEDVAQETSSRRGASSIGCATR